MSITISTAANLAGSIVPTVVSLVTVPLYLQLVGQERYGILVVIWLLLGYFGVCDLGLGRAMAQRIAAFATASAHARERVFWTAFLLNAALGVLGAAVLWPLAELAFSGWMEFPAHLRPEALGVVPWVAAAVPLVTVSGVLTGALQGREQFLVLNLVHVLAAVVSQVAPLVVAAMWEPDIRLLVPTILVTRVLTCVVLLALCRYYVPLRGRPAIDRTFLRPLLGYGSWITVTSLVGPLLTSLDRIVIGALSGAKAVTQYTVPFTLVSRVMILPGSLSSALFPRFAAETAEGAGALLERAVRGLAAALTPLILAAMLGIRPFLTWWVGDEFSGDAATVGQIMALGLWLNGLAHIPHALLQARSRPDLVAKCHLVELPLYLGLLWVGLHFFDVIGAAVAWSLRVGLDAGLLLWLSRVEPRHLLALAPSGALVAAMAALVLPRAALGPWQWILAVAVLLLSAAWSWRTTEFRVGRLPRLGVPARADL
jgi:O-antigen/teichoic acid export membrane protein